MSLCDLTSVQTQKKSLMRGHVTWAVVLGGPSPCPGCQRAVSSALTLSELYLPHKNCGHVSLYSALQSTCFWII